MGCLPAVSFAVLFLAGWLILYWFFLTPIVGIIRSADWEEVPCTITRSQFEPAGPDAFRPSVRYAYSYNGTRYVSKDIWFIRTSFDTLADAQALVARYPKGMQTTCFVNPDDPTVSVLERGLKPQLLIALVPLGMAIVGLVGLAGQALRVAFPGRPAKFSPARRVVARPVWHTGRRGVPAFAVVLLLTVLWNGVISFLVREVIDNWRGRIPLCYGWFITVVSIPFILIGLGLVLLSVYLLLKLLNPRPTISLSAGAVSPGSEVEVSWHFSGWTGRMRRLRIYVEGREEALYDRGEEALADVEVFSTFNLLDTTHRPAMCSGRLRLRVPADAMPSFQSDHNRIIWALRLHAELQRWPDIDEEVELLVRPAEVPTLAVSGGGRS